jgi:hypothetical protein
MPIATPIETTSVLEGHWPITTGKTSMVCSEALIDLAREIHHRTSYSMDQALRGVFGMHALFQDLDILKIAVYEFIKATNPAIS